MEPVVFPAKLQNTGAILCRTSRSAIKSNYLGFSNYYNQPQRTWLQKLSPYYYR